MRLAGLVAMGLVALACASPGAVGPDPAPEAPPVTESAAPPTTEPYVPPDLGMAPALAELDGWLQSDVDSLDAFGGQVVILQFWTFGCVNCKNTLPHLQALYDDHRADGLEIVGVHSPEFDYEKDPTAIAEAARRLGVTWPIALDTEKRNFFGWQGSPAYWPRTYVIDRDGRLRFDHIGEGGYDELAATVEALLEGA